MSTSLPRIRTMSEIAANPNSEVVREAKLKFRKLQLDTVQELNGQERKKTLKTIKTQRLKSLQRYSTVQEQREYKHQKIYLNLIERKLQNGTYDEKKQTGNQLNLLKQKRDHIRVDGMIKIKEIQRISRLLQEIKLEITGYLQKRSQQEQRVNEVKQRLQTQNIRSESARACKLMLQNMIKVRQEINLTLGKRYNDQKEYIERIKAASLVAETQQKEATEKIRIFQLKLESLLMESSQSRKEREQVLGKQQQKIQKRVEGEIMLKQKQRKSVDYLKQKQRKQQLKQFYSIYDKILTNLFASRHVKVKMIELQQRYESLERAYNIISTYKSFVTTNPQTFVDRFIEQTSQKQEREVQIKKNQQYLEQIQTKNTFMIKELQKLEAQRMLNEEKTFNLANSNASIRSRFEIDKIIQQKRQLEEKILLIKKSVLRMLKTIGLKGEKRLSGSHSTLNNLALLTNVLREEFKHL